MSSFTIRKIEFELTEESIDDAINQINEIRNKIQPAMINLIEELTEKGVEIAKAELIFFSPPAYDYGDLQASIRKEEYHDGCGKVIAGEGLDKGYAVYVEYGTGIAGGEGQEGYRQTGWTYFNDRIGKFVFTTGMRPRPFMHNTLRDLEDEVKAAGGRILAEYLA